MIRWAERYIEESSDKYFFGIKIAPTLSWQFYGLDVGCTINRLSMCDQSNISFAKLFN